MTNQDNSQIVISDEDKYKYQKADFIKAGIKEGSFIYVMNLLELNTPEFCMRKTIKRNLPANFYTEEAMQKVLEYLKSKKETSNSKELVLYNQNKELEKQVQNLQNAVAILESQYTKQISELKDEWYETEKQLLEKIDDLKEKLHKKELEYEKSKNSKEQENVRLKSLNEKNEQTLNNQIARNNEINKIATDRQKEIDRLQQENDRLRTRGFFARLFNK